MNPNVQNKSQTQIIPPEIKMFLEGLLTDSGMLIEDDETKEEMIKEMYVRLDNFIAATIINKLPPEYLEEFTKISDEKKPLKEVEKFLKDKLPNYKEVFAEAFANFRQLYIGNVSVSRNTDKNIKETQISHATIKKVN